MQRREPLIMLIGASGSGKTSTIKALERTGRYVALDSTTTGAPKKRDHNRTYVSEAVFNAMVERGDFILEAQPFGSGTPWFGYAHDDVKSILRRGLTPVCELTIESVERFRRNAPNLDVTALYIMPPSLAELERRLTARDTAVDPRRWASDMKGLRLAENHLDVDHVLRNDDLATYVAEATRVCDEAVARARRQNRYVA